MVRSHCKSDDVTLSGSGMTRCSTKPTFSSGWLSPVRSLLSSTKRLSCFRALYRIPSKFTGRSFPGSYAKWGVPPGVETADQPVAPGAPDAGPGMARACGCWVGAGCAGCVGLLGILSGSCHLPRDSVQQIRPPSDMANGTTGTPLKIEIDLWLAMPEAPLAGSECTGGGPLCA